MAEQKRRVIIVGAGPVGLALGLALVRQGVPVVVLEAEAELCPESRAPGILAHTLEVFRRWGVLDSALAEGFMMEQPQIVYAPTNQVLVSFDLRKILAGRTAHPGILILPQDRTVRILAAALKASPLAELRMRHRVTDIRQTRQEVSLQVTPTGGSPYTEVGAYVVGCDGASSIVREVCGWQLEGKTYASRLMLADVTLPEPNGALPWPRVLRSPTGEVVAAVRMNQSTWRIIAALRRDESDEAALQAEAIRARATEIFDGREPRDLVWASSFRIHCRTSPHFRTGRILLAGDAAHINSPAGGQGMNSGIQDACNLGWKLAACLADGDSERLLASYENERRAAITSNVDRYTDLLTRFLLLGRPAMVRVFASALRLILRNPFLTQRLADRAMMLDTHYRRSPCLYGSHRLVGRLAPDGDLVSAQGEELRLFDLIDPRAALLVFVDTRPHGQGTQVLTRVLAAAHGGVAVYGIARNHAATLAPPHLLTDPGGVLWHRWRARDGMVALVRPDGHIGWAARRPSAATTRKAILRVLGRQSETSGFFESAEDPVIRAELRKPG